MITQNRKTKNRFSAIVFLVLLTTLFLFFLTLNIKIYQKRKEAEKEMKYLQAEMARLKEQKSNTIKGSEKLGEEEIERMLREEGNMKKEGEKVAAYYIAEETNLEKESGEEKRERGEEEENKNREEKRSFWDGLKKRLGIK